ncbi:ATP-dependent DNA ligase [Sphingobacterium griseoflavum]|uniref:DNA ligase (ATP) n=1 Tax=Sphingobacterium griseoflavum TaxID=1474952 RepID=A0ABQ3HPU5_9SPHI|nr:ATP-dependent DNA ligase [Sphingobacterium griseoflavum]GHE23291.1 ATP-dependent DNA ligase [Sphingobacterium griseoflavum]
MIDFVHLFEAIDGSTKTSVKVAAMLAYLQTAADSDKLFAMAVLMGNKPKRPIRTADLRIWASEESRVPLWLIEESYYVVGDLAETISLILPPKARSVTTDISLRDLFDAIVALRNMAPEEQRKLVTGYWSKLEGTALFLFNKLLTGNLRVGVSRKLVVKAVAQYLGRTEPEVEHRLMGKWSPFDEDMDSLFQDDLQEGKHFLPYPFYLAYALDKDPGELGDMKDWIIEPKLDGIRGQVIVRKGELFVWSRGEDLMTDKFVEFEPLRSVLPDGTVIDGEVIPWKEGKPMDFSVMQTRIGRKNISKNVLAAAPLVMVCYDLLEWEGRDIREWPLHKRRSQLQEILAIFPVGNILKLSSAMSFDSWDLAENYRQDARKHYAEGLMIKHRDSPYEVGRKRGNWWKWKTDPMTIDGVLVYAQSGHGRRANLFTDYTFAVWDQGELVPFTKAYSGLTDKELFTIDNWIKRHTIAKFGPVRSVTPELVFELAFEGINASSRHKSGVALRFPRIVRWRQDKPASEANSKEDLLNLIASKHESIR